MLFIGLKIYHFLFLLLSVNIVDFFTVYFISLILTSVFLVSMKYDSFWSIQCVVSNMAPNLVGVSWDCWTFFPPNSLWFCFCWVLSTSNIKTKFRLDHSWLTQFMLSNVNTPVGVEGGRRLSWGLIWGHDFSRTSLFLFSLCSSSCLCCYEAEYFVFLPLSEECSNLSTTQCNVGNVFSRSFYLEWTLGCGFFFLHYP